MESEACLNSQCINDSLLFNLDELSLKLQPFFLSKLPPELRTHVWGYFGPSSAYKSLIIVAGEVSRLADQVHRSTSPFLTLYFQSQLIVKMTKVFGIEYIQSLHADTITIPITGRSFSCTSGLAMGIHGICARKIIGRDWYSDWFGKVPRSGIV